MSRLIKGRIELNTTPVDYQILDQLREDYFALIDLLQYRAYQRFLRTGKANLNEQEVFDILNGIDFNFPQTLKNQVAKFYLERTEFMRTYRLPMRPRPYQMVFSSKNCFFTEQNKELKLVGIGSFKIRQPDVIPELGEIVEFGFVRLPKKWDVIVISRPLTEEEKVNKPVLAKDLSLEEWLSVDRRGDEKVYKPEFRPEMGQGRYSTVLKLFTDESTDKLLEEMSLIQHRIFNVVWEEFLNEYKTYDKDRNAEGHVGVLITKLKTLGKINLYDYPLDVGRSVKKEIGSRFNRYRLKSKKMDEFKPHKVEDMHYFYSTSGRITVDRHAREVAILKDVNLEFEGDIEAFNERDYATYLFFKKGDEWHLRITQSTEKSKKLGKDRYFDSLLRKSLMSKTQGLDF